MGVHRWFVRICRKERVNMLPNRAQRGGYLRPIASVAGIDPPLRVDRKNALPRHPNVLIAPLVAFSIAKACKKWRHILWEKVPQLIQRFYLELMR